MFLLKNSGTSIGHWIFGLACAAIAYIGVFAVNCAKKLRQGLRRDEVEVPLTPEQAEQVRQSFFNATFSIMGHVAKADGPIKKSQISLAQNLMQRMNLTAEHRAAAIALFNKGKHEDFDLDRRAKRFRDECAISTGMYRVFLEMQIQAALADGKMAHEAEAILLHVAKVLGVSASSFRQMEVLERVSLGLGDNHNNRIRPESIKSDERQHPNQRATAIAYDAYGVLGVRPGANRATIKSAYRKLMNQHHPDKLISQGVPDEVHRLATDKTQEIQKAYEQIKLSKSW